MIKKTAIAFATSILLGAGASLTALPAAAADAPVKAEQVKSLPNIAILATGGTIAGNQKFRQHHWRADLQRREF